MTTLIHTADVHLRSGSNERWNALDTVLNEAREHDADLVTIGGDLFDRPEDVETLRTELRSDLFSDQPFEILLIPGNHDIEAFTGDLFFGDSCTIMAESEGEYTTWIGPDDEIRVVAIPYQEEVTDDLLIALNDREPFDGADCLLFHGSLDAPIDSDTGDESAYRYFPISEDQLTALDFDYYLAGHYHSPHQLQFKNGGTFVYPGTPASTRSSEIGRRQVVMVDTSEGLGTIPLDTFHHLKKDVTVTPGSVEDTLTELQEWVESSVVSNAEARIIIDGFIDISETAFNNRLQDVAAGVAVQNNTRSAEHVIDHPVMQDFKERLETKDWDDETRAAVWQRALGAASEVASKGGFS